MQEHCRVGSMWVRATGAALPENNKASAEITTANGGTYLTTLELVGILSLQARRVDLSKCFFRNICKPDSCFTPSSPTSAWPSHDIPSQEAYCVSKTKSPNKKILLSCSVLCSSKFSIITVWSSLVFAIIGSVFFCYFHYVCCFFVCAV